VTEKESDIEKIVAGCLRNDRLSQRQLYDKYAADMFWVCRRYSDSLAEAEDILMEGFMNVFKHLDTFRGESSLKSWITKVMINAAISHFRNSAQQRMLVPTEDMDLLEGVDVEEQITTSLQVEQVLELVKLMPKGMQVVFNLRAVDECEFSDIAKMLNKKENAIRNTYMRARRFMMEQLRLDEAKDRTFQS
jgi:RNA polymerase sigma-70 factor (ECF subfamily)